jgi:CheY-like chemotaxis protein
MSSDASAGAPTVLVVEDDRDGLDVIREALELHGYRVVGVTNGADALNCLRDGVRPCLILLDLMLPVMNGWQFRAAQKRDAALASIPVIVISAYKNVGQAAKALEADFLAKPLQLPELLSKVGQFCAARPAAAQSP